MGKRLKKAKIKLIHKVKARNNTNPSNEGKNFIKNLIKIPQKKAKRKFAKGPAKATFAWSYLGLSLIHI